MHLVLHPDRCRGSGRCWRNQPKLVRRGSDGLCRLEGEPLDDVPTSTLRELEIDCPSGALRLEGDEDFYDFPNVGP